jgi:hypothetical protein
MESTRAEDFAAQWVNGWNDHDIEAIMSHFAENVVWTSPVADALVPGSGGRIEGKAALRSYYEIGLRTAPDLHFEIIGLYLGVKALVINYRNHRRELVNEVLMFGDDWFVREGHGTYLSEPAAT